jgi:endo-1,4-beta-xylanase
MPLLIALPAFAAQGPFDLHAPEIKLWPNGAPGSEGKTAPERWIEGATPDAFHRVTDIHNPSITVFLPPKGKANGAAFVVAPGGGHRYLVMDLEENRAAHIYLHQRRR